jgi:hypothetical protein
MNTPIIERYFHCRKCVAQKIRGRIKCGLTAEGFRCDCAKHGLIGHFTPAQLTSLLKDMPHCDCCPGGEHVDTTIKDILDTLHARGDHPE